MSASWHCCACSHRPALSEQALSPGLPARECAECNGHWVCLDDHRRWVESGAPQAEPAELVEHWLPDLASPARACPQCDRIMERLRTGRQPDVRIDRCVHCHAVWLDGGEWAALQFHEARLDEVLSDMWQRQLREAEQLERREDLVRQRHGDACIDEVLRIQAWLQQQAEPGVVLNLIRNGW
ncbi:Zn-finger nucleic acid-binding protein [Hydrogenophaga palleronii]|uniref:Zn-finger nucleic acid-binding protein n=1 Tax=Hydrogenophaga palleronii TaxID=65655 RepID=A0ABU1WS40_9BURK|nr:zf-TFIIB domain-containing protein [Hydrogenophaga palleronii]MDR7152083.1 Zn-finger nucleic acid-binding protein [Hydrogenophaga palleronii]